MDAASTYVIVPFISGLFNVLIDRLATNKMTKLLMGRDSTMRQLSKLKRSMMVVERVIYDAENKQDHHPGVKDWLDSVKHALYDAEDLVDEIYTEALQQMTKSETESSSQGVGQVLAGITANLGRIAVSVDPFYQGIESRLADMNETFEGFTQLIDVLGLKPNLETSEPLISPRIPTTSSVDESRVYGRDLERDLIIKILQDGVLEDHHQGGLTKNQTVAPVAWNICVVSIVGMPGIGKTTLAQLIFNDTRVDDIFKLKAWIHAAVFDIFQITTSILNLFALHSSSRDISYDDGAPKNLELIQKKLQEIIVGKRLLIVLDDVQDENLCPIWEALWLSLRRAAPGSTVVVTTHNKDVAALFNPIITLPLPGLSDDDCWSLIKACASIGPLVSPDEALEAIGRRIAARCRGLPLAAKALGGLLNHTYGAKRWEAIENSRIWDLPTGRKHILPALLLSYNLLPPHLKRCFAYCSIFPKNYQFEKEKLLLLWMAEGLTELVTGDNCFDNLVARAFFQESSSSKHHFLMHDLIHELAVYAMGKFGLMLEAKASHADLGRPRHLSYKQIQYDTAERFNPIAQAGNLRTFLAVRSSNEQCHYLCSNILQSLEQWFRCLRVLSLCSYKIISIPPSIGSLKHLRYLDLSSTLIEELPETLGSLFNLQTLLLSHCHRLKLLPIKMSDLTGMSHLDIRGTIMLEKMPEHIGRLSRLQTLTDFVVAENQGASLGELQELVNLKGRLRISGFERVVTEACAARANLSSKEHLYELVLEGGSSTANGKSERLLQALKPHINLGILAIVDYNGTQFPDWVGLAAFKNLEVLRLQRCPHCVELPPLGQLKKLKHLVIEDFSQLRAVGSEFYGEQNSSSIQSFKSLKSLKFTGLLEWKEWFTYEADASNFPNLRELYVWDCPKLNGGFPLELPSLRVLSMRQCPEFHGSLPRSPLLRELSLEDCGKADLRSLADYPCLTSLSLHWERPCDDQIAIVKAVIPCLTSLGSLALKCSNSATSSDELRSSWCIPSSVRSLSTTGIHGVGHLLMDSPALQYAHIGNSDSPFLQFLSGQFQMLNYLSICRLLNLKRIRIIPEGDCLMLTSLYDLSIEGCSGLRIFPFKGFLAANLTTLSINDCSALVTLADLLVKCFPSLQFLSVMDCAKLESLSTDRLHYSLDLDPILPSSLQTLCIWRCPAFENWPMMSSCTSLQLLDIAKCPQVRSIHALPRNLPKLKISECKALKYLPDNMCSTLGHLNLLHISDCPEIMSFPRGGLPPNLQVLHVRNCEKLIRNNVDWQLHKLIFLEELAIEGFEGEGYFPANGSLPFQLIILSMEAFPNIGMINCVELKRIACLRELEIRRCQSLQTFSEDLPRSLCSLMISECPSLVARCQGPDLVKISHVSFINLDP